MSRPIPFLIPLALLIWGWWKGAMPVALVLAAVVEVSPRVSWRWEISDREFDRVVDFSGALLIALTAYFWFTTPGNRSFLIVVGWLPTLLFPLLVAQRYSSEGSIDLSSLLLSIRRIRRRTPELFIPNRVRMDGAYVVVCLVAAASTNQDPVPFFIAMAALAGWSLFPTRSRRYPPWAWGVAFALAVGLGLAGQASLRAFQGWAEESMVAWFQSRIRGRFDDPTRQTTAIGELGNLKLSPRVDWVLRPLDGEPPPELLRRAVFQTYQGGAWNAPREMTRISPAAEENAWQIGAAAPSPGAAPGFRFTGELWQGRGLIPLPATASRIERLPAQRLESNSLGSVLATEAPDFIALDVRWQGGGERMAAPAPEDLVVPSVLAPSFERVARELGLAGLPPRQAMERIEAFFSERFSYSLSLPDASGGSPPLTRFLLDTRRGHCEYFASAGVILARVAGVPTRYASGYAVMERDGDQYILRARHSHAWTLAWVDGQWQDWDFTPGGWVEAEAAGDGALDAITTRFSLALLAFREYRLLSEADTVDLALLWIGAPLLLFIAWRIYRKPRRAQVGAAAAPTMDQPPPATALQPALDRLEALGLRPEGGETLQGWLVRLHGTPGLGVDVGPLLPALALHYRARFHPQGAGPTEIETMRVAVEGWLRSMQTGR